MTTQIIRSSKHPMYVRRERIQDVLLVSSFALWATVLGFMPVLAYRLLTAA